MAVKCRPSGFQKNYANHFCIKQWKTSTLFGSDSNSWVLHCCTTSTLQSMFFHPKKSAFVIQVCLKMSQQIISHKNHCRYYFLFMHQTGKKPCALHCGMQFGALCAILMRHLFHVGWMVDKCRPT